MYVCRATGQLVKFGKNEYCLGNNRQTGRLSVIYQQQIDSQHHGALLGQGGEGEGEGEGEGSKY